MNVIFSKKKNFFLKKQPVSYYDGNYTTTITTECQASFTGCVDYCCQYFLVRFTIWDIAAVSRLNRAINKTTSPKQVRRICPGHHFDVVSWLKNSIYRISIKEIVYFVCSTILIVTTEILRNVLFDYNSNGILNNMINDVKCIIFDEVHYINDIDRGSIWEETIILLDQNIQLVM